MHLSVAVVPAPDQVVVRLTGDAGRPTLPRLVPALTTAAGHGTASIVVGPGCSICPATYSRKAL